MASLYDIQMALAILGLLCFVMGFIVIGLAYLTVIFRRFCSSDYYKHLRTFVIPAATQTNGNGIDEIDEIDEIDGTDEIDDTLRTDLPSMEVWGEYASQDDESHMVSLMGNPVTVTVGENDLVSSVFSGWGQNPLPQLSNGQGKPTNVNSFPGNSIHKHKRNESASSTTVHSKIKATDKQSASVVHHHHEKTIIQCKHTLSHDVLTVFIASIIMFLVFFPIVVFNACPGHGVDGRNTVNA